MIFLDACSFLKGNEKRVDLKERGDGGGDRRGGRENCNKNTMYERKKARYIQTTFVTLTT